MPTNDIAAQPFTHLGGNVGPCAGTVVTHLKTQQTGDIQEIAQEPGWAETAPGHRHHGIRLKATLPYLTGDPITVRHHLVQGHALHG